MPGIVDSGPFGVVTRIGANICYGMSAGTYSVKLQFSSIYFTSMVAYEIGGVPSAISVTKSATGAGTAAATGSLTSDRAGLIFAATTYDWPGSSRTITPAWTGGSELVELDELQNVSAALNVLGKAAANTVAENPQWTYGTSTTWGTIAFVI
jgi:hypothetical protein